MPITARKRQRPSLFLATPQHFLLRVVHCTSIVLGVTNFPLFSLSPSSLFFPFFTLRRSCYSSTSLPVWGSAILFRLRQCCPFVRSFVRSFIHSFVVALFIYTLCLYLLTFNICDISYLLATRRNATQQSHSTHQQRPCAWTVYTSIVNQYTHPIIYIYIYCTRIILLGWNCFLSA